MAHNLYTDTRGRAKRPVPFTQAVIDGLAEGGGLYVPERIPQLSLDDVRALADQPYAQRAARIYRAFDVDLPADVVDELMAQAYGDNFDDERICPITSLNATTHVLELWHGPTSAFKDMALQCLPKFFSASAKQLREQGKLDHEFMILVATSGDTGKAALEGFRDAEGVSIGVMYPDGGVSDIQFKQMATQRGENVQVWGVRGNFDDCQTGAKNVFGDEAFAARLLEEHGVALSSANSINWGRLVPQIVYYFYSYAQLVQAGELRDGAEVDFCVPTGNFGDILAGWYAKQMGLPVGRLICASNQNDVLTQFLSTGVYDAKRPFYKTSSPSMDILVSSNLERLLYHVTQDAGQVAGWMQALAQAGRYEVPQAVLGRIRQDFACASADDGAAAQTLGDVWRRTGYLMDPHTAVAYRAACRNMRGEAPCVVLSTASPYKFPSAVLAALGQAVPTDEFEAMHALASLTGLAAPQSLAALRDKPVRFESVIEKDGVAQAARML